MGLIKKILKMGVASKMADDYGVFPAAMYLANSKPDIEDEICEISLTKDVSQFEIEKNKLCNYLYDFYEQNKDSFKGNLEFTNRFFNLLDKIMDADAESYNLISPQINNLIEDAIYFNRLSEITYQLKKIVDDNLDEFSKEEQQELYKKINYAIDVGTKAKSKKRMLNLIKELKKHRITLTNEEEVVTAINNGFE